MSRKPGKRKRTRQARDRATPAYRQNVRQADDILAREGVDIRPDNWQQLAVDWLVPGKPERGELARYIADHEPQLGVAWARDILRLEVFLQAKDHSQVIAHYERALLPYPRCALVEMWVADQIFRHEGDFWRARRMYRYAIEHLPDQGKPYYELGFMSYLLGDFSGALGWFDQAAERVSEDDVEIAARIYYNRGMVRVVAEDDREAAIADVEEALRRKPDYPQAKDALRGLRGKIRWVPW